MACLDPGKAIEASRFLMPVRLEEAALALEEIVPQLVNSTEGVGDCRALVAITDKFESCAFEQIHVESMPEPGGPIVPIEGNSSTEAFLDSWLAKGTLLGEDGEYSVFVAFLEVMRRPRQGSWTVQSISVMGTRQSVRSLLDEIAAEESANSIES